MSIKLEGYEELNKKLIKLADSETIKAGLQDACMLVEEAARKKAPKGEGDLRRSISSRVEGLEGIVFTPLEYAPYVEYGTGLFAEEGGRTDVPWKYKDERGNWHSTSGMAPQPYMRPALIENRDEILKILKGAIKQND